MIFGLSFGKTTKSRSDKVVCVPFEGRFSPWLCPVVLCLLRPFFAILNFHTGMQILTRDLSVCKLSVCWCKLVGVNKTSWKHFRLPYFFFQKYIFCFSSDCTNLWSLLLTFFCYHSLLGAERLGTRERTLHCSPGIRVKTTAWCSLVLFTENFHLCKVHLSSQRPVKYFLAI